MTTWKEDSTHTAGSGGPLFAATRDRRRLLVVVLTVVSLLMSILPVPAPSALADGPAVVGVAIEPVDYLTGAPQTDASYTTHGNRIAYRISYSCAVDVCTDTTVTLPPHGFDPTYGQFRMHAPLLNEWTAPFTGATISGNVDDGVEVNLGDLAAGQSGTFTVVYGAHVPPSPTIHNIVLPQAYFPPGHQVEMSATIESANSDNTATADAAPVTWNIQVPDNPAIVKLSPGPVDADTEVTYEIRMSPQCFMRMGSGHVQARGQYLCAKSYTVVDQLPAQAEYVGSSDDGVFDPVAHTVTWSVSGVAAAPGFGHTGGGWTPTDAAHQRFVTVNYPASNFPEGAGGADFVVPVTNQVSVDMMYLDDSTGTAETTETHDVGRTTPFAKADASAKDIVGHSAGDNGVGLIHVPPDVTGYICPSSGQDDWGRTCTPGQPVAAFGATAAYWRIVAYNQANVPGVAVIEDDLDHADAPVWRIQTLTAGATIEYTLDDGTTGTSTNTIVDAPAGNYFTHVRVTSPELAGPNLEPTGNASTAFQVRMHFTVDTTAPIDEERTNTLTATMTYPDYPELDPIEFTRSRTIRFVETPTTQLVPRFFARFVGAPVVHGPGGQPVPGRDVTYSVRGVADRMPDDVDITPQYVFVAPEGWTINPDSASFPDGSVPAGVTFDYRSVTISGVEREAVVASWPSTVAFGQNETWPTMSVTAQPTFAVAVGTTSVASAYMTDSRNTWDNTEATYEAAFQDAPDLDGDGSTTEWYASRTQSIVIGSTADVTPTKEICLVDPDAADGCEWVHDPDVLVGVSPTATDIRYRVTLQNTGNSTLGSIVAYDVLPHVGDTGLLESTASSPRGSTVGLSLTAVSDVSPGLSLSYSTSTNPCREEVYESVPGCVPGWTAPAEGAVAIRMAAVVSLAPGESVSFEYTAALDAGATDGAVACNSVAVDSDQTIPSEPRSVCATTQEADFGITTVDRFPLQEGRVGVVPFVVENHGGATTAGAVVGLTIPAGLTLVDLVIPGWDCDASSLTGPVEVTCAPVNGDGSSRTLDRDTPETIELRVIPDAGTGDDELCLEGLVTGLIYDSNPSNDSATVCSEVFDGAALLSVEKTDGVTVAGPGNTLTYTITASNLLVAEGVDGLVVTDTLPDDVIFESASDGGVHSGADGNGRGGLVTWPAADLGPAGTETSSADSGTGASGSTLTRTVTVRVVPEAAGEIDNLVEVAAPDPADPASELRAEGDDVDGVRRVTVAKASDAATTGVREGDVVTYTVTLTNDGVADFTAGNPAVVADDLSDVLDDADFVAGSAVASVDGGSAESVADPDSSGLLEWSGPLAVGSVAELSYQVLVGDGDSGDRILTNTAFASGESGECEDGLGTDGISCASVTSVFAPVLSKSVDSLSQNDDGTWTVVYGLVVTNLSPISSASYDLSDDLAFGLGIDVVDVEVTSSPDGVTPEAWSGSGAVATGVSLPADAQHVYQVTVVADPGNTVGAPAASCAAGLARAFTNRAGIELDDGRSEAAEACAHPVAPQVEKTAGEVSQLPDGRWSTEYTVTVSNTNAVPGSLAYTLEDVLEVPAGIDIEEVDIDGPSDAPVNPGFDGVSDTALFTDADRITAGTVSEPATRVFTVTVITDAPAGAASPSELACAPAGSGGYANQVTLYAGTGDIDLDADEACVDALTQPMPIVDKEVVASSIDDDGIWTLVYEIDVTNPDSDWSTEYRLEDELQLASEVMILGLDVTSTDVSVSPTWDGQGDNLVVDGQALAVGATHRFVVSVTADPGTLDPEGPAADCRIDFEEAGTGYRNLARIQSGSLSDFAVACEPITDPSVVKTMIGQPIQDPDTGLWTQEYRISVRNRSTTTVGTIPYTLTDQLTFPDDVSVVGVEATAPVGGILNPAWDGVNDTTLATGGIAPAVDDETPEIEVYTVTVRFVVPAGVDSGTACDPSHGPGGLRNEVEIQVGQRVSGDVACADVPEVPVPGLDKTVLSHAQLSDGTWQVQYEVTVANPSSTTASSYTLHDQFAFGAGITLAGPAEVVDTPSGISPDPTWDGGGETILAENILLPAGGSHTYIVRAVLDTDDLRGSHSAADCVIEQGEAGTGLLNTATLDTGVVIRDVAACATIYDPGVTKQINGQPVQQTDGSWLLSYTMTVTNPSDSAALRYALVDELDFPAGTAVTVESAAGRSGSPQVVADWNGRSQTTLVAEGTLLPANTEHVFDVTIRAQLPSTQTSVTNGWRNLAQVQTGVDGVITSEAEAAADIEVPELAIDKTVTAPGVIRIGDEVEYQITITNTGVGDYTEGYPAVVWDDLSRVIDDAQLTGEPSASSDLGTLGVNEDKIWWRGALPSGDTVTISYAVTVIGGGDTDLTNVAYAAAPGDPDPAPPEGDCDESATCSVTQSAIPALSIEKLSDKDRVAQGGTVRYTVKVTNTGTADLSTTDPASMTDDLSEVLNRSRYNGDAQADVGTVGVSGNTLTWTGPLAVGQTATITYSVDVASTARVGTTLDNVASTDPTLAVLGLGTAQTTSEVFAAAGSTEDNDDDDDRDGRPLPLTGADIARLLIASLLSFGVGWMIVLTTRQRRSEET